jgi:probable phosphoglycerate mutase
LADAQHAVAKAIGFPSWPALIAAGGQRGFAPPPDEPRTRLLLVRSGKRISDGVSTRQHTAPGLSALGKRQAHAVAERLASGEFGAIDAVMSSRRPPSVETASIIARALGVELEPPTCDLCEMHPGDAEGLTHDEMFDRFGPNYAFVPNAETPGDVEQRVVDALHLIANRYAGRGVVAVTELVVVASSMTAFAGMPRHDTTSPINPASVMARSTYGSITAWSSLAHGDPRMVGKWQLDCFNDRHLTDRQLVSERGS